MDTLTCSCKERFWTDFSEGAAESVKARRQEWKAAHRGHLVGKFIRRYSVREEDDEVESNISATISLADLC